MGRGHRQGDARSGESAPGGSVNGIFFRDGGKTVLTGGISQPAMLWEAATGKLLRRFGDPRRGALALALSANGKLLATADLFGQVLLWDVDKGKQLRPCKRSSRSNWPSPDGKVLACGSFGGPITLFDPATGKELRPCKPRFGMVRALAFSPDGRLLACGRVNQQAELYVVATGQPVRFLGGRPLPCSGLAFTPDGCVLAAICNYSEVRLWETASGLDRRTPMRHPGEFTVALSPDGRLIASGGSDNAIRLWDADSGREVGHRSGHRSAVISLQFAPDGKTLVSGSWDTTGLVWDIADVHPLRQEAVVLKEAELPVLWKDLAGRDAARAFRAVLRLSAAAREVVPFLGKHLEPARPVTVKRIEELIADLGKGVDVRQRAFAELEKIGPAARPVLEKVLEGEPKAQLRTDLERLLARIETAPSKGQWQVLRTVEVLRRAATPEARKILEKLAEGAPGEEATRAARAALRQLGNR